ncbi:hypothetical protein [Trujillonella humicola]|uniref:hypothetical protein n=1 Tax=Trujillonella humicola TaxID=3383699 RepID=UPI0039060416
MSRPAAALPAALALALAACSAAPDPGSALPDPGPPEPVATVPYAGEPELPSELTVTADGRVLLASGSVSTDWVTVVEDGVAGTPVQLPRESDAPRVLVVSGDQVLAGTVTYDDRNTAEGYAFTVIDAATGRVTGSRPLTGWPAGDDPTPTGVSEADGAVTADGRVVLVGSNPSNTLRTPPRVTWVDPATGAVLSSVPLDVSGLVGDVEHVDVEDVAVSPDGSHVALVVRLLADDGLEETVAVVLLDAGLAPVGPPFVPIPGAELESTSDLAVAVDDDGTAYTAVRTGEDRTTVVAVRAGEDEPRELVVVPTEVDDVAVAGGAVWLSGHGDHATVTRVRLADGAVRTGDPLCGAAGGPLAVGGDRVVLGSRCEGVLLWEFAAG